MNRQIKFRLHDPETKRVIGFECLDNRFCTSEAWQTDFNSGITRSGVYHGDAIRVQYTGIKDSRGKEIYEGDIIECDRTLIYGTIKYVIEWNNTENPKYDTGYVAGYIAVNKMEEKAFSFFDGFGSNSRVIGNVLEHFLLLGSEF